MNESEQIQKRLKAAEAVCRQIGSWLSEFMWDDELEKPFSAWLDVTPSDRWSWERPRIPDHTEPRIKLRLRAAEEVCCSWGMYLTGNLADSKHDVRDLEHAYRTWKVVAEQRIPDLPVLQGLGGPDEPTRVVLPASQEIMNIPTVLGKFRAWSGPTPPGFRLVPNKPAIEFEGSPMWHEFVILRILERNGWEGVWTKNWRGRAYWGAPGEERVIPQGRENLLERLRDEVGSDGGAWDIYAWNEDHDLFIESKQKGKDSLRSNQLRWLEAAIEVAIKDHPWRDIYFAIAEYQRTSQ